MVALNYTNEKQITTTRVPSAFLILNAKEQVVERSSREKEKEQKIVQLHLRYMPSFVSVDYSLPFEVKLLAQRGMSERQLKGDSHISPRAACHLGGKYVCMERGRERESFI